MGVALGGVVGGWVGVEGVQKHSRTGPSIEADPAADIPTKGLSETCSPIGEREPDGLHSSKF